jgi:hypothetical protein
MIFTSKCHAHSEGTVWHTFELAILRSWGECSTDFATTVGVKWNRGELQNLVLVWNLKPHIALGPENKPAFTLKSGRNYLPLLCSAISDFIRQLLDSKWPAHIACLHQKKRKTSVQLQIRALISIPYKNLNPSTDKPSTVMNNMSSEFDVALRHSWSRQSITCEGSRQTLHVYCRISQGHSAESHSADSAKMID